RRPAHPAVLRLRPAFQFLDMFRIPDDEVPDGMGAEAVAGGPVGDVVLYPVPEDDDVVRLVAIGEPLGPGGYHERLLHHPRSIEFLAEGEDLLFFAGFDLLPVLLCDRGRGCRLHPVAPDLLLEEPLTARPEFGVRLRRKLLPYRFDDR